MQRLKLGTQDALWLEMDRPNNLMVADVAVWTATPLDFARLRAVFTERLVERYPVFRSIAVRDGDGDWWWEFDETYDPAPHFTAVALDDPDDPAALQELMSAHRVQMLDRRRPLWQIILVERYRSGSALVFRSHHAIADGMRMVQLAMSLFDAAPEGGAILGPAATAREPAIRPADRVPRVRRLTGAAGAIVRVVAAIIAVLARAFARVVGDAPRVAQQTGQLAGFARRNPLGAGGTVVAAARRTGADLGARARAAVPPGSPLAGLMSSAPGDLDAVRKFVVGTRNHATLWTGTAGIEKGVAWSDPLPLPAVKAVAKAKHCTVNDVLVATAALALHDYLRARDAHCSSVAFMVPVNLKALDLSLPETLGNEFALAQLELPTDDADPQRLLDIARRRMNRIKNGNEAAIAFRLQEAIAGLNRRLYQASVDLFTNRTVGVLTNVPGPPIPVYLAGALVQSIVGWAPLAGNQPMSFGICSYNGEVTVGIACDTALVPGYQDIVHGFGAAFDRIARTTPGVDQPAIGAGGR